MSSPIDLKEVIMKITILMKFMQYLLTQVCRANLCVLAVGTSSPIHMEQPLFVVLFAMQSQLYLLLVYVLFLFSLLIQTNVYIMSSQD